MIPAALRPRIPLMQAPMAGASTPQLAAAVCNAGGLGSLAAAYMFPDEIRKSIHQLRSQLLQPATQSFAVNLFAPTPPPLQSPAELVSINEHLNRYRRDLGLPVDKSVSEILASQPLPDFKEQLAVIVEEKVPIFSFTFGCPSIDLLRQVREKGILVMGTATNVAEALHLASVPVDAIFAQGFEAGGHRGGWIGEPDSPESSLGTVALVSQILSVLPRASPAQADHRIAVVAAGGIMNGHAAAAMLRLGADLAGMGTAFLNSKEVNTPSAWRKQLIDAKHALSGSDSSVSRKPVGPLVTRVCSGRPARMLSNKYIEDMTAAQQQQQQLGLKQNLVADFPLHWQLTRDLRVASARQHKPDYLMCHSGQGVGLIEEQVLSASELVSKWAQQLESQAAKL